jgi:hypothetical protein
MAMPNGLWPLNLSVESLVLREIVPIAHLAGPLNPCGLRMDHHSFVNCTFHT